MAKTISFGELKKKYQGHDEMLVEVTDRESALGDIASKTSCCWTAGRKIDDTGWIQLASPSKVHKEDIKTVFVCQASLIA